MELIFILYTQNPKLLIQREKERNKGSKGKEKRKKKRKSRVVVFLHPFSGGARFIE